MTDPVPSSLLRQEGPQQERLDLTATLRALAIYCFQKHGNDAYLYNALADLVGPEAMRGVPSSPTAPTDLLARLRDYHDQVLKGFRHISRVEEAELIQASIDYLRNVIDHPVTQEMK